MFLTCYSKVVCVEKILKSNLDTIANGTPLLTCVHSILVFYIRSLTIKKTNSRSHRP